MTLHEATLHMMEVTAKKTAAVAKLGYTDSDYDSLENYLDVTARLLIADYNDDTDIVPGPEEAPWCPQPIIDFLEEYHAAA